MKAFFPRGLRTRTSLTFALLALLLSVTLSVVTYELSRFYLLGQRESLATRQVMINAVVAKELIASDETASEDIMSSLGAVSNARAVIRLDGVWHAAVVDLDETRIPASLIATVDSTGPARQLVRVNGAPYIVVGTRLPGMDADYFEFISLSEYQRTLSTFAATLVVAASITTVIGAFAGWMASRRVIRPLADVAVAARAMSAGDLTRRLDVGQDVDLAPVASSFNDMATSLEHRIAREQRFTSDVSHELRTPLTAMASAVSLAQRDELPERAAFAVDVLGGQVDHMRRLTLELLEISRIDAGAAQLSLEDVDVVDVSRRVLAATNVDAARLDSALGEASHFRLDRVRFERILANLVENAERYGGGMTRLGLSRREGYLVVVVDDDGPGVPAGERSAIFGRFHRGSIEQPRDRPKGTGLGLALVDEHVRMHGGSVSVIDGPSGGARFIVHLPVLP
jgi:two-component system, OmpR family, sensor histidine kinase MtrB